MRKKSFNNMRKLIYKCLLTFAHKNVLAECILLKVKCFMCTFIFLLKQLYFFIAKLMAWSYFIEGQCGAFC